MKKLWLPKAENIISDLIKGMILWAVFQTVSASQMKLSEDMTLISGSRPKNNLVRLSFVLRDKMIELSLQYIYFVDKSRGVWGERSLFCKTLLMSSFLVDS